MAIKADNEIDNGCETCDNRTRLCRALHRYKPTLECPFVSASDPTASGKPCMPCSEIEELDKEIEETENRLRDLADKRIMLKQKVNKKHDSLTSRLCPEMIGEIFGHYVDIPEIPRNVSYPKDSRNISTPLTLAAVCTAWRRAVFSVPELWASIHVYLPHHCGSSADAMATVESWLERAGSVPLSITVMAHPENRWLYADCPYSLAQALDASRKFISNWQRLTIITNPTLYTQHKDDYQLHSSSLETLRLFQNGLFGNLFEGGKFSIHNTPSLTHLELYDIPLKCIDMDWHTITHIDACDLHTDEALEILRLAPRLVDCKLSAVSRISDAFPLSSPPITNFTLRHLYLSLHSSINIEEASPLFEGLRCLNGLTSFEYQSNTVIERTDSADLLSANFSPFSEFLSSLGDHLTHLTMGSLSFYNDAFNSLIVQKLETLPHLVQLALHSYSLSYKGKCEMMTEAEFPLLKALEYGRSDKWMFLPNLEHLELSYWDGGAFSWGAFCKIFSSDLVAERERCTSYMVGEHHSVNGRPLRRIVLRFREELMNGLHRSEDEHKRLVAVRNAGVKLNIYLLNTNWDEESIFDE